MPTSAFVVGLVEGRDQHPDDLIRHALIFARRVGAALVFATVGSGR